MYVQKTYVETKMGAAMRNRQDGNQGRQKYVTDHQEFLGVDQEVIVAEAEKQQTDTEAAAAARKDLEHHRLTSA